MHPTHLCRHFLFVWINVLCDDQSTQLLHFAPANSVLVGSVQASYQHVLLLLLSVQVIKN